MCKINDERGEGLTDWEIAFIASLIDWPPDEYFIRQVKILKKIHEERCP